MSDKTDKRVVWILGSGFSRPLGGPMLNDLFSLPVEQRIKALLGTFGTKMQWSERFEKLLSFLRAVHDGGDQKYKDAQFRRGPWANAEEFLEYVDLAGNGDAGAHAIVKDAMSRAGANYYTGTLNANDMAHDVRRYLAAACEFFVGSDTTIEKSERWAPYRRWAKSIGNADHVITFNYDRVVESLPKYPGGDFRISEVDPNGEWIEHASMYSRLIKLHGSVKMARPRDQKGAAYAEIASVWDAIRDDYEFQISGPGPGKLAASQGDLRHHWRLARHFISRATHVVLIGYRMPETDSFACQQLAEAFRGHPNKKALRIRIVLGPNRGDDVRRLEGILTWAGYSSVFDGHSGPQVIHEPLWAQDFLSVFERERL